MSPPTRSGSSRPGAMTPCKRTMDRGCHGGVSAAPAMRAGASLVQVAGRVGAPVAGEDGGAHRDLRLPPGNRRRADADARSIAGPVPGAAPVLPQFVEDQLPDGWPCDPPICRRSLSGTPEAARKRSELATPWPCSWPNPSACRARRPKNRDLRTSSRCLRDPSGA